MAVRVGYTRRMGYWTARHNGKNVKVWICRANCLWAEMNFYRKVEDGKRTDMAQLCMFYADMAHLKRCLADNCVPNYQRMTFFAENMTSEAWKAVKVLAEHGIKVTIK